MEGHCPYRGWSSSWRMCACAARPPMISLHGWFCSDRLRTAPLRRAWMAQTKSPETHIDDHCNHCTLLFYLHFPYAYLCFLTLSVSYLPLLSLLEALRKSAYERAKPKTYHLLIRCGFVKERSFFHSLRNVRPKFVQFFTVDQFGFYLKTVVVRKSACRKT